MTTHLRHLTSILILSFFIFIAFGSDDDGKSKKIELTSAIEKIKQNEQLSPAQKDSLLIIEKVKEIERRENQTVSSKYLVASYASNEVSADNNFKNKTFYIEGKIEDIGKDILDNIYITLKGSSDNFSSVQCYIDAPEAVAKLRKGQFITVKGTCDGLLMNVLIKNCTIVENLSDLKKITE